VNSSSTKGPSPVKALRDVRAYVVPRAKCPMDLLLDGNEGTAPPALLFDALRRAGVDVLQRYPDARPLEAHIARMLDVAPACVLVTAGADDAIDRVCRAFLSRDRTLVMPSPTFAMIARYAALAGATVTRVPWPDGPYPTAAVCDAIDDTTAVVTVVTPNNPTGAIAREDDIARVAQAAPHALVLVDLAYGEFDDVDLTRAALTHENVVVTRTFSKAWGLAGLRTGYVVGPERVITVLRAAGAPYAVSGPSVAIARARLDEGDDDVKGFVARVKSERVALETHLASLGARPVSSHANFVFARTPRAAWIRDALAGLGIAVRAFPGDPELDDAVRITCPGDAAALARLTAALTSALRPEALLFDLDGVWADVSRSYRRAITETARSFGVSLDADAITTMKARGGANNDWDVTHRLLLAHGVEASLDDVTARFEALYQGTPERRGLHSEETPLTDVATIARLAERLPIAVVTGRPRKDAHRFLEAHGFAPHVRTVVCMEDAPLKPDPAPVRQALERLSVRHAWMLGDTPDDVRAARAAFVVPLGILSPSEASAPDGRARFEDVLIQAGAGRILHTIAELEEMLS